MSDEEKEKIGSAETFPVFERLSQIGREIGDQRARSGFIESVLSAGLDSTESVSFLSGYIQSVEAEAIADTELAVDAKLKLSLQIRERVLPRVAAIVLFLDVYFEAVDSGARQLAEDIKTEIYVLLDDFNYEIVQILEDPGLVVGRSYFEQIKIKALDIELPGQEDEPKEGE